MGTHVQARRILQVAQPPNQPFPGVGEEDLDPVGDPEEPAEVEPEPFAPQVGHDGSVRLGLADPARLVVHGGGDVVAARVLALGLRAIPGCC